MKTKHLFRLLALALLMLVGGASPAWAWKYNTENQAEDDNGTGTYNFRYENEYMVYNLSKKKLNDNMRWFKTTKYFNADNGNEDCYWWRFKQRIVFKAIVDEDSDTDFKSTKVEGTFYIVTSDGQVHEVATYTKKKDEKATTTWTMTTTTWGDIHVSDLNTSDGTVNLDYWPSDEAIKEGVKQVRMKNHLYFYYGKDRDSGDFQYEKDVDVSSLTQSNPLKDASFEWNEDGNLDITGSDMKNFAKNSIYNNEYYSLTRYFKRADGNYVAASSTASLNDMSTTQTGNSKYEYTGTVNWKYTYNSTNYTEGAFTTPVLIKYYKKFDIKPSSDWGFKSFTTQTYNQDKAAAVCDTIQPYTRPENVTLDFDKWNKKVTISWTKREKATCGTSSGKDFDVSCKTDGTWYVIRFLDKGDETDYNNYTQIGTKSGNARTLSLTDDNIDYDTTYIYRVVFLPDVLENYSNKLTSLPGQATSHNSSDLWEEESTSTKMDVSINLSQDRADSTAIHLEWEYLVKAKNCSWIVYKRANGSKTWNSLNQENDMPVDTLDTYAEYSEEGGSVCTYNDYRVMVQINGKKCYSNTISANLPTGAYIKEITASKGTEESTVIVKWKVGNPGSSEIQYSVLRRQVGEEEWQTLTDDIYGTASEYTYTDTRPLAGSYYEYTVKANGTDCDGQIAQSDDIVTPGFSQARGVLTGNITYGSGTAVSDVKVNLIKQSSEDETDKEQYLSRYIEGQGKGLTWTADTTKYENKLTGANDMTLEMWVRPKNSRAKTYSNFIMLNGGIELGLKTEDGDNYYLYHVDGSDSRRSIHNHTGVTFDPGFFTHVAAVYRNSKWYIYTGADSLTLGTSFEPASTDWSVFADSTSYMSSNPTLAIGGSYHLSKDSTVNMTSGKWTWEPFAGYVDEIRLWSIAPDEAKLKKYYDRLLSGKEDGLELYWPLDEGLSVKKYAFDYSCQDGIYLENHPDVGANAIPRSESPSQLSLYGLTDSDGNYTISGIPFSSGGTNYKVAPEYGVHEFNPNTRTMYVSSSSLTSNGVDFQDESSFPMSGYLYYAGTNIPVEGAYLYVDGTVQTKNAEAVLTDEEGYYEVDVPIGDHYVEIKSTNHTMADGGRFPTVGTYNFYSSVTHDFADSTLVNYTGRVSGGEVNDTIPVGFAASNNNIGMAVITLKVNNESYSFNCEDDRITNASAIRTWESDTTSINSTSWTGTGDFAKYIYIRTDSVTGEFSAMIPPLKYSTKSIKVTNNDDVEFTSMPEIDLSNILLEGKDSLEQLNEYGDTVTNFYSYHLKKVFTYRSDPVLEVTQKKVNSDKSAPAGIYGRSEIEDYEDEFGTTDITGIWYLDEDDGEYKYKYEYPIYKKGDKVVMDIYGYEPYTNYDTGEAVTEEIPMAGQEISLTNEMSDTQKVVVKVYDESTGYQVGDIYEAESDELTLDSNGKIEYAYRAGTPNTVSPYTRPMSIKYTRNDRTRTWDGFSGVILGSVNKGNNFVTLGPDQVSMILRDAPGGRGQTTWTTGSSKTKYEMTASGNYGDERLTVDVDYGLEIEVHEGDVVYVGTGTETSMNFGGGFDFKFDTGSETTQTWTTTATESISTVAKNDYNNATDIDSPSYLGDVFIGCSTNLIIGECDKVNLYRDSAEGNFYLDCRESKTIGDSVTTAFKYSAYELENVMIPKWKDERTDLLTFIPTAADTLNYVNNTDYVVYLCWLDRNSDEVKADSLTSYCKVAPAGSTEQYTDSVNWCNQQISSWKQRLADNEEDKWEAIKNGTSSKYFKENISFDGQSAYNYTSKQDTTYQKKHYYNWKVGIIVNGEVDMGVSATSTIEIDIKLNTENGWTKKSESSDYDENTDDWAEFAYNLEDGNGGTDFTVNIYKSPSGWGDIFSIAGGQSYNPYEGSYTTKYFEKGEHILQNGTEQMEQPVLRISKDGTNPSSHIVLTDVPSGQEGEFYLHLTNNTSTSQGFKFTYFLYLIEHTNPGLIITMDGWIPTQRMFFLDAGKTVTKVLKVRQADQSVLDFEGIEFDFRSNYQPYVIYDQATFDIHFKPASSVIDLQIDEPTLNNETFVENDSCLVMKLKNYDLQFKNLKQIGVQYRFAGNTTWTTLHKWMTNEDDVKGSNTSYLDGASEVKFALNMSNDISYPEGSYEFRAFTMTPYDNEEIYAYSDAVTVTKDLTRPRNLYTPDPKNGVLGYDDQLAIEFNEDIVPGYVSSKNVVVTAKLNKEETTHEVSLALKAGNEKARTANPVYLNDNFSMEFWLNWHDAGTILQLGDNNNLALTIDDDGYVTAKVAGDEFNCTTNTLPKDEWTYFALAYDADSQLFDLLAQYDTETVNLFEHKTVDAAQSTNYSDDNHLYLGDINADMHGLTLYDIWRAPEEASAEKYQSKDCYVYGLANYWPMDEGHGNVAADERHTHDFQVSDSWKIDNTNYALTIDNADGATANIAQITTTRGDSYAIELWHKLPTTTSSTSSTTSSATVTEASASGAHVVFETTSPNSEGTDEQQRTNKLRLYYDASNNLVLDYGNKSQTVASYEDFPETSNWRHFALNVQRGQSASFYLNGKRTAVIPESDVPSFEGSKLLLGQGAEGTKVDELRIWHATLSEDFLTSNIYNVLDTAEVYSSGLVAYYPFETTGTVNGVTMKVATYEDLSGTVVNGSPAEITSSGTISTGDDCPPLRNAEEETRLTTSPVASERNIVINLSGSGVSPRDLEGTTLNVTVSQVHDLNGNTSNPIRWTALVQQNTLKWAKDSVNIFKKYGETTYFDVDIENKSGSTEYYTLKNLPDWIQPVGSELSDVVLPLRTKTLRFAVDPDKLIPVGTYDLTFGLQGNNEIMEPLRVVAKVTIDGPDWAVDPSDYEYAMNVVGQIYINGVLMSNADSRLAAFVGSECRGVAAPKKMRGAAYVPLTIYASDDDETLTFRIWDATTGTMYSAVNITIDGETTDQLTFDHTQSYGTFDAPVIFTKGTATEQPLSVQQGWNWLSLGIEPTNSAVSSVFSEVTSWTARLKNQGSAIAYCDGSEWAGNLKDIHANTMYKLYLSRQEDSSDLPSPLVVNGEPVGLDTTYVTLTQGWTWIAFTPQSPLPLDVALAAANPKNGDQVKSQTGFAYYGPYGWEGSLKTLQPGRGYLYKSGDAVEKTFTYPKVSAAKARRAYRANKVYKAPESFTPLPHTDYPDNMTMVVKLTHNDEAYLDAELAAFIDGECRGAVTADRDDELYYLLIAGQGSGQLMELRVAIDGEIYTVDTSLTYRSDGNIGTPWEPYVIELNDIATGIRPVVVGTSDDTDWYNIQGMKLDRKPTRPGVYIHGTQKVVGK